MKKNFPSTSGAAKVTLHKSVHQPIWATSHNRMICFSATSAWGRFLCRLVQVWVPPRPPQHSWDFPLISAISWRRASSNLQKQRKRLHQDMSGRPTLRHLKFSAKIVGGSIMVTNTGEKNLKNRTQTIFSTYYLYYTCHDRDLI